MLLAAKVLFQFHHELISQRKLQELDLKNFYYQKVLRNNDVHEMFNEETNWQLEIIENLLKYTNKFILK